MHTKSLQNMVVDRDVVTHLRWIDSVTVLEQGDPDLEKLLLKFNFSTEILNLFYKNNNNVA